MKILYISQYCYPEVGATSNRVMANAQSLKENGHDITILTEMPNHPKGIIFDDYKGKLIVKEKVKGLDIIRLWVFTSQIKNFITRLLFYTSFSITGSIYMLFSRKKYDLIYVTSPPLFTAIIGLFIKFLSPKTKMIFEARDMWPDSAIDLGELKNKWLIKFSLMLEQAAYKKSIAIITVTENLRNKISQKGFSLDKIYALPNGTDLINDTDIAYENPYIVNKDSFKVIYTGNLGIAQNLTTIVEAAEILKGQDITFYLIGAGPEERKLKAIVNEKQLTNVIFTGIVPKDDIPAYYRHAQCSIVPLRKIALFESAIPSKIFDSMALGLPVLVGVDGEAQEVIKRSQAGLNFEPENAQSLSEAIMQLKNNREILAQFSHNGIEFVKQNYDRRVLAQKIEDIINKHIND
ncbi:MAG TPA: glycosyltransferase family 4 protein [Candidatus Cloacimonadota bacterium]|jgi:glycosyltransferase involved in cell wall biosynthesis|nr:glycosyltransferase family 4 protein [Candidatus Cloacimonadales bacterium]HPY96313.1 glycosyltransferase family 4 protein [Candidatus Cloacimonadota bacterium]HQB40988.1 glycosyltransferase family 4 protein [Candidatus Cloacimonadota bacterium]